MSFECLEGKVFENVKRNANSETIIQKGIEMRTRNHIMHVQFERKISVSQSMFCIRNIEYLGIEFYLFFFSWRYERQRFHV